MRLSDRAEDILETLWGNDERNLPPTAVGASKDDPAVAELVKAGLLNVADGVMVMTGKGCAEGRKAIRRHRLAERLFTDVVEVNKRKIHSISCQFEHLLHEGVEDSICTLLGHPKLCPHGKPIPPGECCKRLQKDAGRVIQPLSELPSGRKGKVSYLHTKDKEAINRLMAMGILPGVSLAVIQASPSCVIQIGHSQFALDKELAERVHVRMKSNPG